MVGLLRIGAAERGHLPQASGLKKVRARDMKSREVRFRTGEFAGKLSHGCGAGE